MKKGFRPVQAIERLQWILVMAKTASSGILTIRSISHFLLYPRTRILEIDPACEIVANANNPTHRYRNQHRLATTFIHASTIACQSFQHGLLHFADNLRM
ncbi:hypothetical protein OAA19_02795 [Rubripirellula sp.]|nr:hypothetical protein [Rubripirellula sp.]MDB4339017.1 hypothetical protein [Rubripirellula sp.]